MPDRDSSERQMNRRFWVVFSLVVVAAFGLRLSMASAFVGLSSPPDGLANPDQVDFEAITWQVAQGNGFVLDDQAPTARRAVGTVITLAPPYLVAGRSYTAGRMWLALLSAATCGLVIWIGVMGFNRRAGLIAGGMLVFYPGHAYYAMHFLSETPFGFWLALSVAITMFAHRSGQYVHFAIAGVCWGMLILTKPQFVLMLPMAAVVAVLFAVAIRITGREKGGKSSETGSQGHCGARVFVGAAIVMALSTMVISPWIVRNARVMGTPGLSTIVGHGLWGGNNALILDDPVWRGRWLRTSELERRLHIELPEGEAEANQAALHHGLAFIRENPRAMPGLVISKIGRLVTPFPRTENKVVYWSEAAAWVVLAPLCAFGVVRWWRERRGDLLVMLLPIAVTLAVAVVFFAIVRYRNALSPILVVFAAPTVAWLIEKAMPEHVRGDAPGECPLAIAPIQQHRRAA